MVMPKIPLREKRKIIYTLFRKSLYVKEIMESYYDKKLEHRERSDKDTNFQNTRLKPLVKEKYIKESDNLSNDDRIQYYDINWKFLFKTYFDRLRLSFIDCYKKKYGNIRNNNLIINKDKKKIDIFIKQCKKYRDIIFSESISIGKIYPEQSVFGNIASCFYLTLLAYNKEYDKDEDLIHLETLADEELFQESPNWNEFEKMIGNIRATIKRNRKNIKRLINSYYYLYLPTLKLTLQSRNYEYPYEDIPKAFSVYIGETFK